MWLSGSREKEEHDMVTTRKKKRGPGRPRLGRNGRTIVRPIKWSANEIAAIGKTLSDWIRERVDGGGE